jgi:hypothetical protein
MQLMHWVMGCAAALAIGGCSERQVVMADLTADERFVQIETRGHLESYEIYAVLRDNRGNIVHEQKLVGNIDLPSDVRDYVAYARQRGDMVVIGVLDDPYVQQLDSGFGRHLQMCRYSQKDYEDLTRLPTPIFSSQGC